MHGIIHKPLPRSLFRLDGLGERKMTNVRQFLQVVMISRAKVPTGMDTLFSFNRAHFYPNIFVTCLVI